MGCNPWRWLWGLIPIAMLTWLAFTWEREGIETDLRSRAELALEGQGFGWGQVELDGRDAVLTGKAPDETQPYRATDTVRNIWGVRVVRSQTDAVVAHAPAVVEIDEAKSDRAAEEAKAREAEVTAAREAEAVRVREAEELKAREAEAVRVREAEELKAREAEAVRVREAEELKAREAEAVRVREAEELKAREAEAARVREAEEAKAREAEAVRVREAEELKAREAEAVRTREAEEAKARDAEVARVREAEERTKAAEAERQAEDARKAAEDDAREQAEADAEAQRLADEQAKRMEAEAAAAESKRKAEEEVAAKQRAADEAEARRKEEIDLAARKAQDEAAAKKKAEADRCQGLMRSAMAEGVINFDRAKADLTRDSYQTLDRLAGIVKACPEARINIVGHTDSEGLEERNQGLSERRAGTVASYLESKGVERSRLSTIGYGESRPIASNDTPEGMRQNRRIEFNVSPAD